MDNIVRGGNWYFDEFNAWRVLDEVDLPEIGRSMEAFTPAAHSMSVEWPEEFNPLSATIKLKSNDDKIRGLCGREPGHYTTCTYYEHQVSYRDGSSRGRIVILKGLLNALKQDAVRGLKTSGVQYTFSTIVMYRDIFDGKDIHKFDYFAGPGATIINGERIFAAMASNLAISGGTAL